MLNRGGPLWGSDLVIGRHTVFPPLIRDVGESLFPHVLIDRFGLWGYSSRNCIKKVNPMKKPDYTRLTVSLRDDVHDVIARLSVLAEMPKSKVITGLLEESLPTLLQVLQAFETAKATKKLDVSVLEQLLDEGQRALDDARSDIREPK